jgi:hypothetical protein
MSQDVLPGLPEPRFDPRQQRLWPRFIDDGQIVHGQWLRAIAERKYVGTCRHCGQGLIPRTPYHVTSTRTDYQADCRDRDVCRWVCAMPGGRYLAGSTRLHERK